MLINFRHPMLFVSAVAMGAMLSAGSAFATTYDLSPVTDSVSAQFTSVLVYVLPIAGALLAVMIAWRFIRKVVKA